MIHECAYVRTRTHKHAHTYNNAYTHRLTSMPSGAVGGPKCLRDENASGSNSRLKWSAIASDISTPNDGVDYWQSESESPSQNGLTVESARSASPSGVLRARHALPTAQESSHFAALSNLVSIKHQKPRALQPPPHEGLGSLTDQEVRGDIVSEHFPRRGCQVNLFNVLSLPLSPCLPLSLSLSLGRACAASTRSSSHDLPPSFKSFPVFFLREA